MGVTWLSWEPALAHTTVVEISHHTGYTGSAPAAPCPPAPHLCSEVELCSFGRADPLTSSLLLGVSTYR